MEGSNDYPAILLGQRTQQLQQREGTAAVQPRGGLLIENGEWTKRLLQSKTHANYATGTYTT